MPYTSAGQQVEATQAREQFSTCAAEVVGSAAPNETATMRQCSDAHDDAATPSCAIQMAGGHPAPAEPRLTLIVAEPQARRLPLAPVLARLPQLPAIVWSRPTVRAVLKTGASMLALSLAVRAVRQALTSRRCVTAPLDDTLPRLLAETLRPPKQAPRRRYVRRDSASEVTEMFVYARRIVHW